MLESALGVADREMRTRMIKYVVSLFLCAFATTAVAADVSMVGKWDVATSIAGTGGSAVCTFTQKEGALTGACTSDDGDHVLTGKIDGNKVTWQYVTDFNGQPLTIVFTGTVDSDKQFNGSVEVQPMGVTGDFAAKRKQ
jgi:hypothetical protein